jgi:type III restriction enzyme
MLDGIATLFSRRIGELTAEKRHVQVLGIPWRLSETQEFSWRRHFTVAGKTIFNVVACFNDFEADFATFLDKASDVPRFAKLCEHFTGFHVQYLKSSGALGTYYPDFVVVQSTKPGARTPWPLRSSKRR